MRSLDAAQITAIRTGPYTDAYWSRLYRMSRSAIRLARIGVTWPHHATPPDLRPRMPGRRGPFAVLRPEPEPALNVGRLIAGMPAPSRPDSDAEHA